MRLIANRQLHNPGLGGRIAPGQHFDAPDEIARKLLSSGLATVATYETKVITPQWRACEDPAYDKTREECRAIAARPFRDDSAVDPEPAALATLRAAVRAVSDVSEPGDSDRVERPRRGRPRKG